MSSLTRKMQRNSNRDHLKVGNFHSVGTKLGVKNPRDKALLARRKREIFREDLNNTRIDN